MVVVTLTLSIGGVVAWWGGEVSIKWTF